MKVKKGWFYSRANAIKLSEVSAIELAEMPYHPEPEERFVIHMKTGAQFVLSYEYTKFFKTVDMLKRHLKLGE